MSDHLVGIASMLSGIPSLVEVCLHLGDFVVTRLEAYERADEEISDTVLKLATYWDIEKAGIGKLQKICASTRAAATPSEPRSDYQHIFSRYPSRICQSLNVLFKQSCS